MRDFDGVRMDSTDLGTAHTKVRNLPEKLFEIGPALVVNKCLRDETQAKAGFPYPDAPFNIFGNTVKSKTTCFLKYFFADAHIETSGLKSCSY